MPTSYDNDDKLKENSIAQCNLPININSEEKQHVTNYSDDIIISKTEDIHSVFDNTDMAKVQDGESISIGEYLSTSSPVIFDSPVVESVDGNSLIDEGQSNVDNSPIDNAINEITSSGSSVSINDLLERTRSSLPKSELIGHGIYHISAHLQHSCDPNIKLVFPYCNNILRIVASRNIDKGDEICMSYIHLSSGMSSNARRSTLKSTYHITCTCELCEAELTKA